MSSTGRNVRKGVDFYPTPIWCLDRLFDRVPRLLPRDGPWVVLEPAAGDGRLLRRWKEWCPSLLGTAVEIRPGACQLDDLAPDIHVIEGDFRNFPTETVTFDVALTNPPFNIALEIIEPCLKVSHSSFFLLRLNFLGSLARYDFLASHQPNIYILPNRPSFTGRNTDSIEYAWFEFGEYAKGRWELLARTPAAERKGAPMTNAATSEIVVNSEPIPPTETATTESTQGVDPW